MGFYYEGGCNRCYKKNAPIATTEEGGTTDKVDTLAGIYLYIFKYFQLSWSGLLSNVGSNSVTCKQEPSPST